jgi:hypothetical protein
MKHQSLKDTHSLAVCRPLEKSYTNAGSILALAALDLMLIFLSPSRRHLVSMLWLRHYQAWLGLIATKPALTGTPLLLYRGTFRSMARRTVQDCPCVTKQVRTAVQLPGGSRSLAVLGLAPHVVSLLSACAFLLKIAAEPPQAAEDGWRAIRVIWSVHQDPAPGTHNMASRALLQSHTAWYIPRYCYYGVLLLVVVLCKVCRRS